MSFRSRKLVNMALESRNVEILKKSSPPPNSFYNVEHGNQIDIMNCPIAFENDLFPTSTSPETITTAIIMGENVIMNNSSMTAGYELNLAQNLKVLEDKNNKDADVNTSTNIIEIQNGQGENEDIIIIEMVNNNMDNENNIENIDKLEQNITEHENFETLTPRHRVKSQDVHRKHWKPNANRRKRELGLPYQGKIKTNGSWIYDVNKAGKFLAAPCKCLLGNQKITVLKCSSVSKNERELIFQKFWSKYTWPERKVYVQGLTKLESVKRRRGNEEVSKRSFSVKYFLKVKNEIIRVCKKMFLGTLGMKETTILNWIKEETGNEETGRNRSDNISRVRKQKFEESNNNLKEFLASLPKVESHYCRSSSSKLYIEPLWSSTNDLYRFYKTRHCAERKITAVSKTTFFVMFQKMNLSIYTPKKDLCDICVAYDTKNLSEEKYQEHQELKREAREEKGKDKTSSENFVFTMDLQSVLLCPKSTVSAMYYKTKLIVHNFTIYDLKTHDGYCYLWNESEGGLTANEFSSILVHFLEKEVIPKVTNKSQNIILYSDGCTSQNRNSILANTFLNLAMIHDVTIIQKYLQKGHTQMEVDSMHSCIEKKVRNYKINVPADYVYLCKIARRSQPYKVEYLYHTFFKKYDNLKYYSSIRPGKVAGDAVVTNIKALKYNKEGRIHYKLSHTADWQILGQRFKASPPSLDLPSLYTERKKIKSEKFQHLQELKNSLLEDYHLFYDDLPHL